MILPFCSQLSISAARPEAISDSTSTSSLCERILGAEEACQIRLWIAGIHQEWAMSAFCLEAGGKGSVYDAVSLCEVLVAKKSVPRNA